MSEGHELAEKVLEAGHHHHAGAAAEDAEFRKNVGLLIGVLACLLAITTVGGSNMMKRTINANIETSDTYAFYQAKLIRQQVTQAANDELDALEQAFPALPPDARSFIDERQETYQKNIAHWESDPVSGDGKKELLEKARLASALREEAAGRDEWFEIAEAMLQIAVVLASTAVLTASRRILIFCFGIAALGALSAINAFFGLI